MRDENAGTAGKRKIPSVCTPDVKSTNGYNDEYAGCDRG